MLDNARILAALEANLFLMMVIGSIGLVLLLLIWLQLRSNGGSVSAEMNVINNYADGCQAQGEDDPADAWKKGPPPEDED